MNFNEYQDIKEAEDRLCYKIVEELKASIDSKGSAHLLVSGGKSPIGLFRKLSKVNLEWSKVHIGLVDERWVNADSPHSNERLVRTCLMSNKASEAKFYPLVNSLTDREENLRQSQEIYAEVFTEISVVILGMGIDGHTASLFPQDVSSQKHFSDPKQDILINTNSPSDPRLRISCGKSFLCKAEKVFLYITGEEKLSVFKKSKDEYLPIYHFYSELHVFYSSNNAL